jgi:hypothetical protein
MESPAKKLRQQLAILAARQGDPEAPASGTLLARRQRLHEELARADSGEHGAGIAGAAVAGKAARGVDAVGFASRRSSSAIRRDIRLVDQEIDELQRRMKEIDRIIADAEHKGGGEAPRHKPRPAASKRVSR